MIMFGFNISSDYRQVVLSAAFVFTHLRGFALALMSDDKRNKKLRSIPLSVNWPLSTSYQPGII